jgi:Zn-dependent protease
MAQSMNAGMTNPLYEAATIIVPLVFAIVFHEVAHGMVARMLGDRTAADLGRLSLNPLRHVDPFGTIVMPGMLALLHMPVFGYAKPVPVDFAALHRPKRDMALVGAAGPACNFVMAAFSALAIGLILRGYGANGQPGPVMMFVLANLGNFIVFNCSLGLFNLLPIPPFDGSRIVRGIVPWPIARLMDRFEPFGLIAILIILVIIPQLFPGLHLVEHLLIPPRDWLLDRIGAVITWIAGPAAGNAGG